MAKRFYSRNSFFEFEIKKVDDNYYLKEHIKDDGVDWAAFPHQVNVFAFEVAATIAVNTLPQGACLIIKAREFMQAALRRTFGNDAVTWKESENHPAVLSGVLSRQISPADLLNPFCSL